MSKSPEDCIVKFLCCWNVVCAQHYMSDHFCSISFKASGGEIGNALLRQHPEGELRVAAPSVDGERVLIRRRDTMPLPV